MHAIFYYFTLADKVVKVPQMAESISEGTLKQWVKSKKDNYTLRFYKLNFNFW